MVQLSFKGRRILTRYWPGPRGLANVVADPALRTVEGDVNP
jgi:hypothetical protein